MTGAWWSSRQESSSLYIWSGRSGQVGGSDRIVRAEEALARELDVLLIGSVELESGRSVQGAQGMLGSGAGDMIILDRVDRSRLIRLAKTGQNRLEM